MASLKTVLHFLAIFLLLPMVAAAPQFVEPIDQSQGNYQADFGRNSESDGEQRFFGASLSSPGSDGDLTLYKKDAGSKSFSRISTVDVHNNYNTEYQDNYYFNNDSSFSAEDGNPETFTVDGNEHTIEVVNDSIVSNSGSNQNAMIVDGVGPDNYYEGQIIWFSGHPVKVKEIVPYGGGDGLTTFEVYEEINIAEGEDSWRIHYVAEDSYSEQIYTSTDTPVKTPYLKNTTVDDTRIYDFNRREVSLFSTIQANVVEDQGDNYNISLYNNDNGELVAYATTDKTVLIKAKGVMYGILNFFTDTSETGTFNFPGVGSNLFQNSAEDDNYYFTIEDLGNNSQRTTQVFQTTTSGTNDKPEIQTVEGYDGSTWKNITEFTNYGTTLAKIRVTVQDLNNDFHGVKLGLKDLYDNHTRIQNSTNYTAGTTTYTFTVNDEINDSGQWNLTVNATDGDKYDFEYRAWNVSWGTLQANLTVNGQTRDIELKKGESYNWTCTYTCSGGECRSEQKDNTSCYLDPVKTNTTNDTEEDNSTRSQFSKPGNNSSKWAGIEAPLTWLLKGL